MYILKYHEMQIQLASKKKGITLDGTGLNWTQNNYFFENFFNMDSAETWLESRLAIQSGSYVNL